MDIDKLHDIEVFKYVREFNISPRIQEGFEWRIRLAIPYQLGGATQFKQYSHMGIAESIPLAMEHAVSYIIKHETIDDSSAA